MYGKMKQHLCDSLAGLKDAGLYKEERIIEGPQQAEILVKGKKVLNFCANNYLGLSNHPRLIEGAKKMMDKRGFGMSSVRFICGTQDIHKELEAAISDYFKTEDTILYAACFDANGGVFGALFNEEDAIISDALNHASIIDGVRLCKAKRYRYANGNMEELEKCLQEAQAQRFRIVVTDGVFTTGRKEIIDMLRQSSRPYLFSNSLAPSIIGASLEVFKMLKESNELHDKLVENVNYFREKMMAAGFDIKPTQSAICAVMLYDAKLSQVYASKMLEEGIYVTGFYYPVVPKNEARIRVQISAGHNREQLDKCINAFIKIGKELGVLK